MENINIQIGPIEETKIDYTVSVQQLIDFFDEEAERIEKGEKAGTLEFMMLGYAIDFLVWAKNATGIVLDFEEEVIPTFDAILKAIHKKFLEQAPTQEEFQDLLKKATGFLCVVICKHSNCGYFNSNLGIGISKNKNNIFVMNRVGRRLQGQEDSEIISFYEQMKSL